LSKRAISAATGVSRPVAAGYIDAYERSGLALEQFKALADTEAMALLREPKIVTDPRHEAALSFFPYMLKGNILLAIRNASRSSSMPGRGMQTSSMVQQLAFAFQLGLRHANPVPDRDSDPDL